MLPREIGVKCRTEVERGQGRGSRYQERLQSGSCKLDEKGPFYTTQMVLTVVELIELITYRGKAMSVPIFADPIYPQVTWHTTRSIGICMRHRCLDTISIDGLVGLSPYRQRGEILNLDRG
jgi:hypothetical protein